jgi:hypothetical protein
MSRTWNNAQKTIEKFHNKLTKKQKKHKMCEDITFFFSGGGNYTNVPHQVASEINAKKFQEITS